MFLEVVTAEKNPDNLSLRFVFNDQDGRPVEKNFDNRDQISNFVNDQDPDRLLKEALGRILARDVDLTELPSHVGLRVTEDMDNLNMVRANK